MFAGNLTIFEIENKKFTTAYFPVAAFNQYGPHLPLTTDIIITHVFADKISTVLDAFMLPVQPFATNYEHGGDNYSIGLDADVFYEMVLDIAVELKRQGFTRLVIHQNSKELISPLYPLVRHINAIVDIKAVYVNPFGFLSKTKGILDNENNYHACEIETSLMLYLNEDSVRKDKIAGIGFIPDMPVKCLSYKSLPALCPNGVWGYPSYATKEKGRRLFEAGVEACVNFIAEAFKFMDDIGDYTGGRENPAPAK
jgi:creatinine amidohydrolase